MATETNDQIQPPEEHVFSKEEHRRILVILFALMLGMFLAALDQSIVSTALPTIAGDLHNLNELSWVVTSFHSHCGESLVTCSVARSSSNSRSSSSSPDRSFRVSRTAWFN